MLNRNSIKPRVGENSNEGFFRDENGTIKKGNKWVKFPSVVTLGESRPQFGGDREIGGNVRPNPGDRLPSIKDTNVASSVKQTTRNENNDSDDDAVYFG